MNLYREAQEKNDQGLYEQANNSRITVAAELTRLMTEHSELPLASQGLVLEAGERLQRLLEECPAFPDPLVNNVTARETYARRLSHGRISEIVNGQINPRRVIDGSVTNSSKQNNHSPLQPLVPSQEEDPVR